MEPKKFEEHIKKQLQKREIKPSAGSWEKLEVRLEQEENPKRFRFWWVGVAAAIAGVFFFLGTLFQNPTAPAVVEQNPVAPVPAESVGRSEPQVLIASEKEEKEEKEEIPIPGSLPEKVERRNPDRIVAVHQEPLQSTILESDAPAVVSDPQDNKGVAQVRPIAAEVSDAEVDALLQSAMTELEQNPSVYAAQPVDPEDLLYEVEYELEQNFRQKVFEVLKEGLTKAKTAVANRNY